MIIIRLQKYKSSKRWVKQLLTCRFVLPFVCCTLLFSCEEPEVRLTRADRQRIDTLVNKQLDSISPKLDSLCFVEKQAIIDRVVDSIIIERRRQEERLRLKSDQ